MDRPECFEFAMEFLGDPEETVVRKYVEDLERQIETLNKDKEQNKK